MQMVPEARCAATESVVWRKYVYDYGLTDKTQISVETLGGIKISGSYRRRRESVTDKKQTWGKPELEADLIPIISEREQVIDEPMRWMEKSTI